MKFREMRRKDKQVMDDMVVEILANGEYGVLSTISENGYPYGVPVNYSYHDEGIYFHCAKTGHKLDNIKFNDKVSFCIVTDTELEPEEFSTKYKSIIAFGTAAEVEGDEKKKALMKLIEKYAGSQMDKAGNYINKEQSSTVIIKVTLEHITGKAKL